MLNKKIADMLNEQINKELYSAYLYLDFANYYADEGLNGFAHWYEVQAQEERDHALMLRRYLINNGVRVTFGAVAKPDKTFKTHLDPLLAGYEFLDWFIKEQGEEETNADDMVKQYKLFGGDAKGLYALDRELAGRVYAPSATGPSV